MSPSTDPVAPLVAALDRAPDREAWLATYRYRFAHLRRELQLHPARPTAAATFEVAARTARDVASRNLPLGLALVMHLYPLCALRCVPLPWFSAANRRRTQLLHDIDARKLVLANAGSDRAAGAHAPVHVTRTRSGIRIDGTFDYVSLAHVADLVLFNAPLTDTSRTIFCIADMHSRSVDIGDAKFGDGMQLSDTCALTFHAHHVPPDRYIEVPTESTLGCMTLYQRSWFHLLLAESHLARIRQLQRQHELAQPLEQMASLNELACLRDYALHLLDHVSLPSSVESLDKVTAAIKLRVSWLAQATAAALRDRDHEAAKELGYIRLQPTSDERVMRAIRSKSAASH
ncbi:MAG TPA: hypothetical protein VM146_02785 [Steroidobacteraceae bacterium]|nr:hypothetical protein [Steroidobacteraceae bacterium]